MLAPTKGIYEGGDEPIKLTQLLYLLHSFLTSQKKEFLLFLSLHSDFSIGEQQKPAQHSFRVKQTCSLMKHKPQEPDTWK